MKHRFPGVFTALVITGVLTASASVAQIVEPVPVQKVTIDDAFWSPKFAVWRSVTIDDCFDKFDKDGVIRNFDHVAHGELNAEHGGSPWFDGLMYEMIRAGADFLAEKPDAKLEARIDDYITHIAAAAAADPGGYLNTYTQLKEPTHRWGQNGGNDRWQHDLYNAGCLVDAGVHYYRATGKTSLLGVAVKLTNTMCGLMGPLPKQNIVPGHAVGEEAVVGLYRLFKEQPEFKKQMPVPVDESAYLALAKFWIDERGHHEGRPNFHAYDQDEVPVLEQTAIEGHAVRAPLMCSGLTAVGLATGQREYFQAADRLWASMVDRRMYLTGAVGSFADEERFGPDYVLPNNCYGETCAAVANGFFDAEMFQASGQSTAIDELERTLYNGVLAGVSLKGNTYFYQNPLECRKNRLRWPWDVCPCCPPMFLKMVAALPGYLYSTDSAGLYVNLFAGSTVKTDVAGHGVTVVQTTRYPWDGDVKLEVKPAAAAEFDLNIRVPGWCKGGPTNGGLYTLPVNSAGFSLMVNGQQIELKTLRGFAKIHRTWKAGDVVLVHMDMPAQRVIADAHVQADQGKVAIVRGPLVYCLESIDNSDQVRGMYLPGDASILKEERPNLLNGVTVLTFTAKRREPTGDADEPVSMTAIPYYANANRGPVSMTVWMPAAADQLPAPTIEALARPSASHCNPGDSVDAINDGLPVKDSADESRPRFTWWDHRGTSEWLQYDLDHPRKLSSVSIYWWDEKRIKRQCRVPQNWRLLYRKPDGTWAGVTGASELGTRRDQFNKVSFDAVNTDGLRIEAQMQANFSGGVLQWELGDHSKNN